MELVTGGFTGGSHTVLVMMARAGGDKANGDTTRDGHVDDNGGGWRGMSYIWSSRDTRGRFHQQRLHLQSPRGTCRTCSTKVTWPVLLLLSYRGNYVSLHQPLGMGWPSGHRPRKRRYFYRPRKRRQVQSPSWVMTLN